MTRISSWMLLLVLTLGICLLSETPSRGEEDLDNRIKALKQELTTLEERQVELKKEATAAAAALPTFEYRPGNGLNIEAADKAWGLRAPQSKRIFATCLKPVSLSRAGPTAS